MISQDKLTKIPIVDPDTPTYAKVEELFTTGLREWEATKTCAELMSALKSSQRPFQISKIVGFACGPLDSERTLFQHAMLLTLRNFFNKQENSEAAAISCYAQDPIYNATERSVLGKAGITVLDDPEGFLEVDESTVVVSVAPNIPVKQIISDIARPALLIWDEVRGEEEERLW